MFKLNGLYKFVTQIPHHQYKLSRPKWPPFNWCKIITKKGWKFVPSFSSALTTTEPFWRAYVRNDSPHYAHSLNDSITIKKKQTKQEKSLKFRSLLGLTFGSLIVPPTASSIVSFLSCNIWVISAGRDGWGACPFTAGNNTTNSTFRVFSPTEEIPGITMSEGWK